MTHLEEYQRMIKNGDLFIAIKGEKNDGHDYVSEVLNKGASLVIVLEEA